MENIINYIIPNNKIEDFQHFLETNSNCLCNNLELIENLFAYILVYQNIQLFSLLNLFVKENNLKFNIEKVYKKIYYIDCKNQYNKQKDINNSRIETIEYNSEIREKYFSKYYFYFKD